LPRSYFKGLNFLLNEQPDQAIEDGIVIVRVKLRDVRGGHDFADAHFAHLLDPKRRLTIPSEWRAQVGTPAGLYVLPDVQNKCLCVFPAGEMMRRIESMRRHSIADTKARNFARALASRSDLVSWDAQGRIRVKDELLNFAALVDHVVLVGAFDRFELWNPDQLKQSGGIDQTNIQDAAQYVGF
jgi:MraZ protein